jgi:hypothetical protein
MKQRLILLAGMLLSFPTMADPLGRLFLTPAERAALDIVRQNSAPPEQLPSSTETEDEEAPQTQAAAEPLPVITIHGYVKRSDGKNTVWVNGKPVQEKSGEKSYEVGRVQGNTGQVPIRLPATGQTVRLKAGQSYDPANNRLADSLRDLPPRQPDPITPAEKSPLDDTGKTPANTAAAGAATPMPPPKP